MCVCVCWGVRAPVPASLPAAAAQRVEPVRRVLVLHRVAHVDQVLSAEVRAVRAASTTTRVAVRAAQKQPDAYWLRIFGTPEVLQYQRRFQHAKERQLRHQALSLHHPSQKVTTPSRAHGFTGVACSSKPKGEKRRNVSASRYTKGYVRGRSP